MKPLYVVLGIVGVVGLYMLVVRPKSVATTPTPGAGALDGGGATPVDGSSIGGLIDWATGGASGTSAGLAGDATKATSTLGTLYDGAKGYLSGLSAGISGMQMQQQKNRMASA